VGASAVTDDDCFFDVVAAAVTGVAAAGTDLIGVRLAAAAGVILPLAALAGVKRDLAAERGAGKAAGVPETTSSATVVSAVGGDSSVM
jgi:hypothetical protein